MLEFIVDEVSSETVSYHELLVAVNKQKFSYCEIISFKSSLRSLYIDVILSLINDLSIRLVDVEKLEVLPTAKTTVNKHYDSIDNLDQLLELIRQSKSTISIYTSGTTGQPKEIQHSVATLSRAVRISEKYRQDRWLLAYNPLHMAGLQVFFQALFNLNLIVNVYNQSRSFVISQIKKHTITHISATPTFYRLLLPFEQGFDFVKRITLGGESSSQDLQRNLKLMFPNARLNNIYASSEAGSLLMTSGEFFRIDERYKDKIRVVGDELQIHKSLLGNSIELSLIDDFYLTGDLIEWQDKEEQTFRFISRKNEMINSGGIKINPNNIENALLNIEEVRKARVFGRPNSLLGSIVCCEVELFSGVSITEADIISRLKKTLAHYEIPRKVTIVHDIITTSSGKIKRK